MKNIFTFILLLLFAVPVLPQDTPPDAPLTPQEWIRKMTYGSWWIFTIPPKDDTNISTDGYSPRILDSLQTLGIHGGRLHWVVSDEYLMEDPDHPGDTLIRPESVAFVSRMIDDFTARGMAICLQVSFEDKGVKTMPEYVKQRHFNGWRQLSEAYRGKSHLLAMCPVIEFHGWQYYRDDNGDLQPYDRKVSRDSLNWLYDSLTVIFREYNPDRIMSYKPWGSSKRGEIETLAFPFGNDPSPHSGQPIYYVASMSGSYGMGEWFRWKPDMDPGTLRLIKEQTMRAGLTDTSLDVGIHHAMRVRDTSGISFWIDHWDPAFWKHLDEDITRHWTIEQNLAYIEFMMDTLKAIGSAGAGMQTRRFWNDKTDNWVEIGVDAGDGSDGNLSADSMSVRMIEMMREKARETTSVRQMQQGPEVRIYPNPASGCLNIEKPCSLSASLYSAGGVFIDILQNDPVSLSSPPGIYLVVFRDDLNRIVRTEKLVIR